jgi:Calcineurin-like phosphoesterase
MNKLLKIVFASFTSCALASCMSLPASHTYSFALIGDQQYNAAEEALFPDLLDTISRDTLAFVVHLGDFKAGSNAPCTDALYVQRRNEFNRSKHPLILLPGDNDWVDCRRPSNGSYQPLERLNKLREIFYASPETLGKNKLSVMRQSDVFAADPILSRYSENMLWVQGGVVYATLNIQGSNDNKGFDAANNREQAERTEANIAWLKHAMISAKSDDIAGLAIFLQANPGFEESTASVQKSAFNDFLRAFDAAAVAFGKPILFAHGDSHQFRVEPYLSPVDKRPILNVTRVEGYGSPFVNWIKITVDANNRVTPFVIKSGGFVPTTAK